MLCELFGLSIQAATRYTAAGDFPRVTPSRRKAPGRPKVSAGPLYPCLTSRPGPARPSAR